VQLQDTMERSAYRTYIVLVVEPPSLNAGEEEQRRWHESFLPSWYTNTGEPRLLHSYTEAISGFAAKLTEGELDAVAKKPGFIRAFPDQTLQLMTTHTPEFLGLRNGTGFWSDAGYGKGVIIGLLDSGIYAAHHSFSDHGIPPPPARWKGSCKDSLAHCNNKLIGAQSFLGGDSGDLLGHGTHTSSTAAGNFVSDASFHGLAPGTVARIAPGAHIAMYKVCDNSGCPGSAILAGFDAAIKDGVDVLSVSLGITRSVSLDLDTIAIGAFGAISKGITVVCAAGNMGSFQYMVINEAPCLNLTDGITIKGQALNHNKTLLGVRPAPVVAGFSSRGPSPISAGVLKPDILAPGVKILAAWPPIADSSFNIMSGTSMATPHISGVVALVKSIHPDWSPATIKSAILTTSYVFNSTGGSILDEKDGKPADAYAIGAGHVNLVRAADPGLVYELSIIDYAGFICSKLGDKGLATIVHNSSLTCAKLPRINEIQLNYPTITVPLTSLPFTVNRTVTNVGPAASTYTVKVDAPRSLTVRVSPETLTFSKVGERKTFNVSVSVEQKEQELFVQGSLSWVSGKHVVLSPVIALSKSSGFPPSPQTV
ncbi:hypothetical protein BRADI_1g17345v3, partial [Brachypodium distachyon]